MRRVEPYLNLGWVALGAAIAAYSWSIGIVGPMGPESGFFPLLAGLLIAGAGMLLLLPSAARVPAASRFWPEGSRSALRVCAIGGVIALAIFAIPHAGFVPATLIAMPLLVRAIGGTRWWVAILVGIVSVFGVRYLFDTLLGVALPRGPLGL